MNKEPITKVEVLEEWLCRIGRSADFMAAAYPCATADSLVGACRAALAGEVPLDVLHTNALESSPLTLATVQARCVERAGLWHSRGVQDWSTMEWAAAMCGEAGEAANVAKKIKRLDDAIATRASDGDRADLQAKLGAECADVLLYLVLLAAREGVDLAAATIAKFNATSEAYGFPQRLA